MDKNVCDNTLDGLCIMLAKVVVMAELSIVL